MRLPRNPPNDELRVFRPLAVSLLLLVLACIAGYLVTHADVPLPFTLYMPLSYPPAANPVVKSAAGCATNGSAAVTGIGSCYNWYQAYHGVKLGTYEVLPMVQYRTTPYTLPFTVDYVGQVWLLLNEPDWGDTSTSDAITPSEGALVLHTVASRIRPQGGLIACCGLLFDATWLDQMLAAYTLAYGQDGRNQIDVYTFHAYATISLPACTNDDCWESNWLAIVQNRIAWRNTHDSAKPIWFTEVGWNPGGGESDWAFSQNHMRRLCSHMDALPVARWFWYVGSYPSWNVAQRYMSLVDSGGNLSPLGSVWKYECLPQRAYP